MELTAVVARLGGIATRAQLVGASTPRAVDEAVEANLIARVGRGRYVLPGTDAAVSLAHAMNATLALSSAALFHGWEVWTVPEKPHVIVPRKRNVPFHRRAQVTVHRRDLQPGERDGVATNRELTLLQCLRSLPEADALAVADSAKRHGHRALLATVAASATGPGSERVRRIAGQARMNADNPFESALRAIANSVRGLAVEPQVAIRAPHLYARPDLVDVQLRMVLEADSFGWHGSAQALAKDAHRYNLLVADGWLVFRFTWDAVMFRPDEVRRILERAVRHQALLRDTRTQPNQARWPAA